MGTDEPEKTENGGRPRSRRDLYSLPKRPLGSGGFADVFLATHRDTGKQVAFKRLRVRDEEARRRFRREIEIQQRLQHRHVMPVLDVDPLFHWYTMPVAESSLEKLLPRLTPAEVARALHEAGDGLSAGHDRQLTHRDVSPSNILALREPDGSRRWVIADWGLVRLPLGQTGTFKTQGPMGTPRFIAPEVLRDAHNATASADIFSLGMVAKVACELREWGPEAGFEPFIRATTEFDPTRRPPTVTQGLELLRPREQPRPPQFLVWTADSSGAVETLLVQVQAQAAPEVLGRCRGLYVCDGERLHEWRNSSHLIWLADRESRGPDGEATQEWESSIEDVSLIDFDTGRSALVSPIEPRLREEEFFEMERETRPIGGAGPLLFVTERVWGDSGGAHGNTTFRFYVIDTRTGLPVEGLSAAEFASQFVPERREAVDRHRLGDDYQSGFIAELDLEDAEITLYRPMSGQTGQPSVEVQFTFMTSYAGSDGLWSSYTQSERIQTDRLPEGLQKVLSPPAALRSFMSQFQHASAMGWSMLPDEPRVDRWTELFVRRSPCRVQPS